MAGQIVHDREAEGLPAQDAGAGDVEGFRDGVGVDGGAEAVALRASRGGRHVAVEAGHAGGDDLRAVGFENDVADAAAERADE